MKKIFYENFFEKGKVKIIQDNLKDKKSKLNLFLITSPFQMISAIEASNYFNLEDNILCLIDLEEDKYEMELTIEISNYFNYKKFLTFQKSNFVSFLYLIYELRLNNYNYIFFGKNNLDIKRIINNLVYKKLYYINSVKYSNKFRKELIRDIDDKNVKLKILNKKYNKRDKVKFLIYSLLRFNFESSLENVHFLVDEIGYDPTNKTYPIYSYIWKNYKNLVMLYPHILIPKSYDIKNPLLMKKNHIGSIEQNVYYSKLGNIFIYPTVLSNNKKYFNEINILLRSIELELYKEGDMYPSLEEQVKRMKYALLLMDAGKYEKILNDIISLLINILKDKEDISSKDFLEYLLIFRKSISHIYKISSFFIHKKSYFIKVNNFYTLFDLCVNKYIYFLNKNEKENVVLEMLNNLKWIFSHYSWRATYYGEREKINKFLYKYKSLFKDLLMDILKHTSIFTYAGTGNVYSKLLLELVEEYESSKIYQKNCSELYNYLLLLQFFSGNIDNVCAYFFKYMDQSCLSIDHKRKILSICLESPKYYHKAYSGLWEIYINKTISIKIQKQSSFSIIISNYRLGNIYFAQILLLYHYKTFGCNSVSEAMKLLSLFKDVGLFYSHQNIIEDIFYNNVFLSMKKNFSFYNILQFLSYQDIFSELDILKDLDFIYQTVLKSKVLNLIKNNAFNRVAIIQPSRSPIERIIPLHIYNKLLQEKILILNLELDPIGFFNDYPNNIKPILSPLSKSIMNSDLHWNQRHNKWKEDFLNGAIYCNDINVYQGIFERLYRGMRVFSVVSDPRFIRKPLNNLIIQIDRAIKAIDILDEQLNYPIIYISTAIPHYPPWSGIRDFFYKKNNPKKYSFIHVTSIYENYLNNMNNKSLTTITALNLTQYRESRAAFLGGSELFKKYVQDISKNYKFPITLRDKDVEKIIKKPEINNKKRYIKEVKEAKDKEKIIVCILGKIPYDLSVPYMGGTFSNMKEWAQETERFIAERDNIFALVKPHPHEKNISISQYVNESFLDFFNRKPENIYMLDHYEATLDDLYGLVDVFLLWNGTSVIELAQNRQNIIVCDDWAPRDYPIDLYQPKTKDEYYKAILKAKEWDPESEIAIKRQILSYFFIKYMKSARFYVNNIGITRSNTNTNFHKVFINIDKIYNEMTNPSQDWIKILRLIEPTN